MSFKRHMAVLGCDSLDECSREFTAITATISPDGMQMVNHHIWYVVQQFVVAGWHVDDKGNVFCPDHVPERPN